MSDLRDLYQEVIFDHNRNPRNFGRLEGATHRAEGFNPLCGDQLTLYLKVGEDGRIEDVAFEGKGCAISTASASLLTESVKGRTLEEAERLFRGFHAMIMDEPAGEPVELGKLEVLAGVKEFPARVKCATLAWHTLHAAIEGQEQVSTE
ncbi:MAG TPA: SUF system NifU family Fe-S cluster assembly protein [Chromatiales bacterium]|nr:SUF system NifU family Fe-S cluster assembly protein [Chromatiales bacterium]